MTSGSRSGPTPTRHRRSRERPRTWLQRSGRDANPTPEPIYSAGITLWEASVGRKFRDGSSPEDFAATEVLASTRDPHLASVIARAIAPDRDQRYLSATEFARALYPSATRRMWRIGIAATFAVTAIILSVILAFREGPSVPAGPPTPRVVATLPFQDRTGQADVEFARTAVPSALAGELRHVQHLSLLLNEQLFERTRCPLALEDVRAWAACAMAAGATMLISGEIDKRGDRLRVEITVSHLDGTRLGALIAETSSSGLIALVRRHAHEIAALIDGRRAGEITIDPDLDLGVEALHQQSFETARRHLEAAWARDPSVPDPLFYLAILDYWEDRSPDDATLARVLAAPLTATQRGILIGFARLSRFELEPALLHFRALADQEPTNPLVSYGLFEALFHGGYPADGISRYRQLAESDRDFRVGLVHAFDYYTAHHDAEGVVWALARAQQVSSALSTEYQIRLRVMNGDLSGATSSLISELDEAERRGTSPPYMQGVLALGMVRDDFGTVDRVRIHMGAPQTDLAIAIWRGQPEDARVALSKVIASARSRGRNGAHDIARVAILASLADDISLSSLALAAIDELLATTPHHTTNEQLARAFLLARLGRRAELARYQSSGIPELARIARALRSNLDGAVAADDWRQAFALSADGQYVLGGKLHLARMLHAQKDLKRVLELCAQILAPRTLDPALGVGSVACAVWSGQAAEQMGKRDQALELYRRVVRVRSSTDSMHQLALDGLRRLGS